MRDLNQLILKFDYEQNFKDNDFYVSNSNKHIFFVRSFRVPDRRYGGTVRTRLYITTSAHCAVLPFPRICQQHVHKLFQIFYPATIHIFLAHIKLAT